MKTRTTSTASRLPPRLPCDTCARIERTRVVFRAAARPLRRWHEVIQRRHGQQRNVGVAVATTRARRHPDPVSSEPLPARARRNIPCLAADANATSGASRQPHREP
jgi:hypothetical protein